MSRGFGEGEMMGFEKQMNHGRQSYGSLKSLFRFSEMQAPPSGAGARF
jgi:hypothetical protein